jgi:serine/threonine protein kinase
LGWRCHPLFDNTPLPFTPIYDVRKNRASTYTAIKKYRAQGYIENNHIPLMKIHSKDIAHRDLKPENIMLIEKEGNCNFVKLLDFGLDKGQAQIRITETGTVIGPFNYMAPEQVAQGEFSLASDIYSLGVIYYETVTNRLPFPGERIVDIMKQIMNKTRIEPIRMRLDLPI